MGAVLHRPLLCAALGFALGIGAWGAGMHSIVCAAALALLGVGLLFTPRPALTIAGIVLMGMSLGALRLCEFQTRLPADISRWADGPAPVVVTGMVDSDPQPRAGRVSFTLRAERIETRGQTLPATGQCAVTLPVAANAPDYGDRFVLDGLLETPPQATNPGAFSWRDSLARRGIYAWLSLRRPQSLQNLGPELSNPVLQLAWHVRHSVMASIGSNLPPGQAAVLGGILIGQSADLSPDLMDDFVRTGTVHILASAGLHVGILALCLLGLLRLLTVPHKLSALLLASILALYALVCGGRPSVTRAVIVAIIYLGGTVFEREPDGPTTLGAAALVILALQPTVMWESGFQLSFLTVLTLAVGMPVWSGFWQPRVERLVARGLFRKVAVGAMELCGLALVAQMGALPLVARDYNQLSLLSVPANLLVVPLLFFVIPLGFAGAAIGLLWHGAGASLLWLCHFGLLWIVGSVRLCAAPGWAVVAVPSPAPGLIIAYYLVLIGCALALRPRPGSESLTLAETPRAFAP